MSSLQTLLKVRIGAQSRRTRPAKLHFPSQKIHNLPSVNSSAVPIGEFTSLASEYPVSRHAVLTGNEDGSLHGSQRARRCLKPNTPMPHLQAAPEPWVGKPASAISSTRVLEGISQTIAETRLSANAGV